MSPELESLIRLQQLETTIAEAKTAIAQQPDRLAELEGTLDAARQPVETAKARLQTSNESRRELEKDVALYQGRLTKFKDQLSAVKTNREYQAMQHEIETAARDLGDAEERVLVRMMEADELTAEIRRAEAELAARSKEVDAAKRALADEIAGQRAALEEATTARAALVGQVSAEILALFEQVSRARKGVAICSATPDGLCSVCHVRLRPFVLQQVRQNDKIVQCDSCHRVLYWRPPPPPAEPPAVHAS